MAWVHIVTLADRPDLAESTFAIPYGPEAGAFRQGGGIAVYVEPNVWVLHAID